MSLHRNPSWAGFIPEAMERWQVPGIALAVLSGDTVDFFAHGTRDRETGMLMETSTCMPVGSLSKSLFALGVAFAVQDKLVRWDEAMAPRLKAAGLPVGGFTDVTLGDLLSMRSGLDASDVWPTIEGGDPAEMMRKLAAVPFAARPGERFIYSGAPIGAASWLFRQATGASWDDFLQHRVLHRLGMTDTSFRYVDVARTENFGHGYELVENRVQRKPWDTAMQELKSPACSMCSTVADLVKFLDLLSHRGRFEGQCLLEEETVKELLAPRIPTRFPDIICDFYPEHYAFGWGRRTYRGYDMVYHRGSDLGYRSLAVLLPEKKLGLVLQTNLHRTLFLHYVMVRVLDQLLGVPEIPWEPLFRTYSLQTGSPAPHST